MRQLFLSLLVSFVFIASSVSFASDTVLDITEVKTQSGITAWLVEDRSVPVIALNFSFRGMGAKTDPVDKQGIARIVSNTMDEGAGDLDTTSFQKELDNLSISLGFSASRDDFGGALKTLTYNKKRAFELLKMALISPKFDEEPVARMIDANKSRIKSSLSNPKWMAARIKNDRIFEGHPYAMNSGGTLSSLDVISIDDLKSFHAKLGYSQLVISAAGDINAEELSILIDDVFASMPQGKAADIAVSGDISNTGKTYFYAQDIPQNIIEITQIGISRDDPDYYASKVMNFILGESGFGSRLMDEVREQRGLTYGIYSYFLDYDEFDLMHVSTSTAAENTVEVMSIIKDQWRKIKDEGVEQKELDDAKSYLIGSLPLSLTSTSSISAILQSMQIDELPLDYLDQRQKEIKAITLDDIKRAAIGLLDEDSFITVIVGSSDGISDFDEIKTLPNVE